MVLKVASVAATVSCQPHIQFISICACPTQSTSYSFAASRRGSSAFSAKRAVDFVITPSCSIPSSRMLKALSISWSKQPPFSSLSDRANCISERILRICFSGMVMPLLISMGEPKVNSNSCFSRFPPTFVFRLTNLCANPFFMRDPPCAQYKMCPLQHRTVLRFGNRSDIHRCA